MALVNVKSIVFGAGKIFGGAVKATVDADIASSGDDSEYNLGGTQDGVMLGWEPSMVDIDVDQLGDAAVIIQDKQKCTIKTTFAEATLQNLALAWGYAVNVSSTSPGLQSTGIVNPRTDANGRSAGYFNVGLHSVYPTEFYIRVQGNGPGTTATQRVYRTYKNNRCISANAVELGMTRSDNTKYSVEFRSLPDPTQTGKEYGEIFDTFGAAPYPNYTEL